MDELIQIRQLAAVNTVPANTSLFSVGDQCEHYVVVLEGRVRVELTSVTGQQFVLYRIHQGQPCVLTTACLIGGNSYTAQAVSETEVEIALIPKPEFKQRLKSSEQFRAFVFDGFAERLSTLIQRTSELVTYSTEQRLSASILKRAELSGGLTIEVTHDELAIEIGSAREVVSRRLAVLEKAGILRRNRRSLEILDEQRLRDRIAL